MITDIAADELVARAAGMRQQLRDGQEAAEAAGGFSKDVHAQFVEHGFYRILQPRRYGGLEHDLETFLRVIIEISRADPGVGWMLCLSAGHAFHLASYWPEQAQEDLFGDGALFIAPGRTAPTGRLTPVEGGYRVTGRWDYCSGVPFSTHIAVVAIGPESDPGPFMVIVPRSGFEIVDDWGGGATLGLQATGSNTVTVQDAFVPAHHAVRYDFRDQELGSTGTPGYQLHGNPLYLGRTLTFFNAELVATQVGNAFAALDEYEELMATRPTSFPPRTPRRESPEYQRWFGEIRSRSDAAEMALLGAVRRHAELGRRWAAGQGDFTLGDDLRLRGVVLQAAQLAVGAVDLAFTTGGSAGAKRGARLQKYYRDAAMYKTHIAAQWDVAAAATARQHFGAPLTF